MLQKGFTLIETIIVLGIIAAIALPTTISLRQFQQNSALRASADEMISNIRKSQSLAIGAKDGVAHGVHFESTQYVIFTGSTYNPLDPANDLYRVTSGTLNAINIGGGSDLVFQKVTGEPIATGYVTLSLNGYVITISINEAGIIEKQENLPAGSIEVPGIFHLVSPTNGAVISTTLTPSFDWGDSSGTGITYVLYHSTSSNFSTFVEMSAGSSSGVTLSAEKALIDGVRNYWKVKAVNSSGYSRFSDETWYVDVNVNQVPTVFNLLTPADLANVANVTPALDWSDSSDPDGGNISYNLFLDDNSDYSSVLVQRMGLTSSTYQVRSIDNLQIGGHYYWKVEAVDDEGYKRWSTETAWSFYVQGNLPPTAFNLLTPTDSSTVPNATPILDWENSTDPESGSITYNLYIDDNSDYSSILVTKTGLAVSTYQVLSGDNLQAGIQYYWKVEAVDDKGSKTWSTQTTWSFNVQAYLPPTAFNLLTPANSSTVPNVTPILDWEDSTDPDGGSVTYNLYIDDNSDYSSILVTKTGLAASTYQVLSGDNLQAGVQYYWKVEAVDDEASKTWSTQTTWSFNVQANLPPTAFNLLTPTSGSVLTSLTPAMDWSDSTDPESGTITYTLLIDNNSDFLSPELTKSGLTASTYTVLCLDNLSNSTTYYWKVIATDGANQTTSTQTNWSFSISSTTLYVNQSVSASGNGLCWEKAYKTIAEAVTALSSSWTVYIANGTYTEMVTLTTAHSGSVSIATSFKAKPGDTNVIINGTGNTNALLLNGTDYAYFEGLQFANASSYGAHLDLTSQNVTFSNCIFRNNTSDGFVSTSATNSNITVTGGEARSNGRYGINLVGTTITLDQVNVYGNTNAGIFASQTTGLIINKCRIYANSNYGISLDRTTDDIVRENLVYSNTGANGNGIYIYRSRSVDVYNNKIYSNTQRGIYLYDVDLNLSPYTVTLVYRNVMYKNGTDGMYSRTPYSGTYYNNTMVSHSGGSGIYLQNPRATVTLRNNLITNNSTGFNATGQTARVNNDYADVWGNTTNFAGIGSSVAGANSISLDPVYVNLAGDDYHLQSSSPCINRGDPATAYNDPDGSRADIGGLYYGAP